MIWTMISRYIISAISSNSPRLTHTHQHRADSRFVPSQWETSLQSNTGLSTVWHRAITLIIADLSTIGLSGTSVKFESKYKHFLSRKFISKYHLQNDRHFINVGYVNNDTRPLGHTSCPAQAKILSAISYFHVSSSFLYQMKSSLCQLMWLFWRLYDTPNNQINRILLLLTHWGSVAYIYAWVTQPSLLRIMASHLVGNKPSSEPMLEYC